MAKWAEWAGHNFLRDVGKIPKRGKRRQKGGKRRQREPQQAKGGNDGRKRKGRGLGVNSRKNFQSLYKSFS